MPKEIDNVASGGADRIRWFDLVKPFEFLSTDWQLVRPFGLVWTDHIHIIPVRNNKRYFDHCRAWDVQHDVFIENREQECEYCRLQALDKVGATGAKITSQYRHYLNCIHYQPDFDTNNHRIRGIYLLDMSPSLFRRVKELKSANGNFSVTDAQKGALILIKCDKNQEPGNRYGASLDTKMTPIDEQAYAIRLKQRLPDGGFKVIEAANGLPAMWEYMRVLTPKAEIHASMKRYGYVEDIRPQHQQVSGKPPVPPPRSATPQQIPVIQPLVVSRPQTRFDDVPPPPSEDFIPPARSDDEDDSMMPY